MNTCWTVAALAAMSLLAACGQKEEAQKAEAPAAGPANPEAATIIKARQDTLKTFGAAMKAMADELKKPEPALAVFQTNAPTIVSRSGELHSWFPAGTGMESGVKTAAKAEIWAQPDDFKAKADAFAAAAQKFDAVVKSGDMAAIKTAQPEFALACRNCHQTYRQRDN